MYEIKMSMQKDEFSQLLLFYKDINKKIQNAYLSNIPIILLQYNTKNIEVGLGIWLYYFNQYAKISFENILKMMLMKVIGNISLGEVMKRFFLLLTANN